MTRKKGKVVKLTKGSSERHAPALKHLRDWDLLTVGPPPAKEKQLIREKSETLGTKSCGEGRLMSSGPTNSAHHPEE